MARTEAPPANEMPAAAFKRVMSRVMIGIVIIILLLNTFFIVGAGHRAVVFSSFGGVKKVVFGEGIHMKIPFFEKAYDFEIRTKIFDARASAASKDLQIVTTEVAVNYHVATDKVFELFTGIGERYEERVIAPSVQEIVKSVTAKHIAEELITKRESAKEEIKQELALRLKGYNIILDDISITNFDFSDEFNHAIELKVTAEQNALREQNNLRVVEYQAQQRVRQAQAEADAIRIVNSELSKSPTYTDYLLLQKWDGKMPLSLGSGSLLSITGDAQK